MSTTEPTAGQDRRERRQMASREAVERRRANRKAAKTSRWHKYQERIARDREIAVRMTQRFFPKEQIRLHWLDKRYWELRRVGYDIDARTNRLARSSGGDEVLLEPTETAYWKWWIQKPHESRQNLIKVARFRLLRQAEYRYVLLHLQSGGGFCSEDERREWEARHARN